MKTLVEYFTEISVSIFKILMLPSSRSYFRSVTKLFVERRGSHTQMSLVVYNMFPKFLLLNLNHKL